MKIIFILVLFPAIYCGCIATAFCQVGSPQSRTDFAAFLKLADAAQVRLQKGDAASYKSLWSTSDEVTLSGGFGGVVEKGWTAVAKRLDWAATQFSNGTNVIERLVAVVDCNIAYVVQVEHIKFRIPSTGLDATRDFRVTMVFRREGDAWKIVHRHADGQNTKQPA